MFDLLELTLFDRVEQVLLSLKVGIVVPHALEQRFAVHKLFDDLLGLEILLGLILMKRSDRRSQPLVLGLKVVVVVVECLISFCRPSVSLTRYSMCA